MRYKIIFMPIVGELARFEKEYETHKEAETALAAIADYTLMLHECSIMPDYSNCGMVFYKDDSGDWIEIDGDGNEI